MVVLIGMGAGLTRLRHPPTAGWSPETTEPEPPDWGQWVVVTGRVWKCLSQRRGLAGPEGDPRATALFAPNATEGADVAVLCRAGQRRCQTLQRFSEGWEVRRCGVVA